MKTAFLALSVLANLGLGYYLASQRTPDPVAPVAAAPLPVPPAILEAMPAEDLLARLRAAHLPEELIRAIVATQVDAQLTARTNELKRAKLAELPYWKSYDRSSVLNLGSQDPEWTRMRRANLDRVEELFGPAPPEGLEVITYKKVYGNLSIPKITAVRAIERKYNAMAAPGMAGKLKEIRDVLTAEEFEEYNFRRSESANELRGSIRGFAPTEAEYRVMFPLQVEFDLKYPYGPDSAAARARTEARPGHVSALRATLSPERQAEFDRKLQR